jgi:hypothetical protein
MQPEDRDIAFLWDILEAAKDIKVLSFVCALKNPIEGALWLVLMVTY